MGNSQHSQIEKKENKDGIGLKLNKKKTPRRSIDNGRCAGREDWRKNQGKWRLRHSKWLATRTSSKSKKAKATV